MMAMKKSVWDMILKVVIAVARLWQAFWALMR